MDINISAKPVPSETLVIPSGNRFVIPGWVLTSTAATIVPTAHIEYALPIYISSTQSYDRICAEVTTGGAASTKFRLGIRSAIHSSGRLTPGNLISGTDTAALAADSIAVVSSTIAISLSKGYYFLIFITADGTFRRSGGYAQKPINAGATSFVLGDSNNVAGLITGDLTAGNYPVNGLPTAPPTYTNTHDATGIMAMLRQS